mmetsp:Transcript_9554/g.22338  ORF Transcript_9554/g.22338 Transcript_9554/m.22338 type:complete len:217 (-) Transcript_9554:75-725(-)
MEASVGCWKVAVRIVWQVPRRVAHMRVSHHAQQQIRVRLTIRHRLLCRLRVPPRPVRSSGEVQGVPREVLVVRPPPAPRSVSQHFLEPVPGRDVLKGLWAQGSLCNLAEVVEALPHPEQGGDSVTEGEGTDNPTCAGLLLGILFVHQLRYGGAPVVRERVPLTSLGYHGANLLPRRQHQRDVPPAFVALLQYVDVIALAVRHVPGLRGFAADLIIA